MQRKYLRAGFGAIITAGLIFTATACQQTTPDVIFPQADYTGKPPIKLQVGSIEIVDGAKAVDTPNRIERKFPNLPAEQIRRWATQRLQAVGGNNRLVVSIDDASATETALPKKGGISGAFTTEPIARVDAVAKVTLRIYTPQANLAKAEANIQTKASRTIQENASPYDRDKILNDMTLKLVDDLNMEAEKQVNAYFGPYRAY